MRKTATAAVGASMIGLLWSAPAQAQGASAEGDVTNLAVSSDRTGGVKGVFGTGARKVTNTGTTVVPEGTELAITVGDMPGLPDEIHANTVTFSNGFAVVTPKDLLTQKWMAVTKKALAPGETASFSYMVLHYAPWHRVHHEIKVVSIPGLTDHDSSDDVAAGLNL